MAKPSITCDVSIIRPENDAFAPGMPVSGMVRYNFSEDTEFDKIYVTLKGLGRLSVTKTAGIIKNTESTWHNSEDYVNMDYVITIEEEVPTGQQYYEIPFQFVLPKNIPSSLTFKELRGIYKVRCNIVYYIHVQFEKNGDYIKNFSEEFTVVSGIIPRLPIDTTVYISTKKLFQVFKMVEKLVTIRGSIKSSVIDTAGKVEVAYEVCNNSDITIKAIETKVIAVYTFYTKKYGIKITPDVKGTTVRTGPVECSGKLSTTLEMDLPADLFSIENSRLVTKDYAIVITAVLPLPYNSAVLEIPIQVGRKSESGNMASNEYADRPLQAPPSYSESMVACNDKIRNDVVYFNSEEDEVKADISKVILENIDCIVYIKEDNDR